MVAITTLAALAGCVGLLAIREDEYEASARILASPIPLYDEDFVGTGLLIGSGDATRDVQTVAEVLVTDRASALTARRLGVSSGRVESSVDIEPLGESNVLAVTATDEDPEFAARLANEYARATLSIQGERAQARLEATLERLTARRRSLEGDDAASADLAQRINRLEQARSEGDDPTLTLTEVARPPSSPVGLSEALIVPTVLLGGLGLGVLLALVLDSLNPRVRDVGELAEICPLPILARVPLLPRRLRRGPLSLESMPASLREAVDALRAQFERGLEDRRTVMLLSAMAGDGTTTTAAGVALAMANAGHSVTAIDANFRRPRLAELLAAETEDSDLRVLLAPPDDPALRELIAEAGEEADFVVIDAGPLSENGEALALTHVVDGITLVVRPGHTRRSTLSEVWGLLDRTGAGPIGMVVTGQRPSALTVPVSSSSVQVSRPWR